MAAQGYCLRGSFLSPMSRSGPYAVLTLASALPVLQTGSLRPGGPTVEEPGWGLASSDSESCRRPPVLGTDRGRCQAPARLPVGPGLHLGPACALRETFMFRSLTFLI